MNITILNTFGDEMTKISYPQLDSRNLLENRKLAEKAGEKIGYRMYGGKSKLTFVEANSVDDEAVKYYLCILKQNNNELIHSKKKRSYPYGRSKSAHRR